MDLNKFRVYLTAFIAAIPLTACGNSQSAVTESSSSTVSYDLEQTLSEDMTDTDKQKQYLAYLEQYLKEDVLESLSDVEDASVTLVSDTESGFPINSGNHSDEIQVNVMLKLQGGLTTYDASELADVIATAVGNPTTDNIVIQDSEGTLLFPDEAK